MDGDESESVEHTGGKDEGDQVDDKQVFADVFRRFLRTSGRTRPGIAKKRTELAEDLGVTEQAICTWERGTRLPEDLQMVEAIAPSLQLLDSEGRELIAAWNRARAMDGRKASKVPPAPEVATKAPPTPEVATDSPPTPEAATVTPRQELQEASNPTPGVGTVTRQQGDGEPPAGDERRTGGQPPVRPVLFGAAALALVVLVGAFALTHRPASSTSTDGSVTRGFAFVTKSGPCRYYANLTATGLPPHAHVTLVSDYIGHKCSNGTAYQGSWRQPFGKVGPSGTWSYPVLQRDYGTYRYTVVTDAGTRTPIDFHYGPQGNG